MAAVCLDHPVAVSIFFRSMTVPTKRKPARVIGEHRSSSRAIDRDECASYGEYLASAVWQAIRSAVLSDRPNCELCGRDATEVHHDSYHAVVMTGAMNDALVSICRECHTEIEFDGDRKLHPKEVRGKLRRKLRGAGRRVLSRLDKAKRTIELLDQGKPSTGVNRELEKRNRDAAIARAARQGDPKLKRPVFSGNAAMKRSVSRSKWDQPPVR